MVFYLTLPNYKTEFVSNFFKSLEMTLDMRLHFTSSYYLEENSQIEQYFYIYYNYQQNNWSDLLLLVEFAYNNTSSTTTRVLSFFVNKRYYSNITVYLEKDITSFYAHEFTIDLNKLQDTLKVEISAIQQ